MKKHRSIHCQYKNNDTLYITFVTQMLEDYSWIEYIEIAYRAYTDFVNDKFTNIGVEYFHPHRLDIACDAFLKRAKDTPKVISGKGRSLYEISQES